MSEDRDWAEYWEAADFDADVVLRAYKQGKQHGRRKERERVIERVEQMIEERRSHWDCSHPCDHPRCNQDYGAVQDLIELREYLEKSGEDDE